MNLAPSWQLYEGRNPAASSGMLREVQRDSHLTAEQTQALVRALGADPRQVAAHTPALLVVTSARKRRVLRAR